MIMRKTIYCNRCKGHKKFQWAYDKFYKCPICGKIASYPENEFFDAFC